MRSLKSGVRSFSVTPPRRELRLAAAARRPARKGPAACASSSARSPTSSRKSSRPRCSWPRAPASPGASSMPRASRHSRRPSSPSRAIAVALVEPLQIADEPQAQPLRAAPARPCRRPRAGRRCSGASSASASLARDDREAARLVEIGGELREKLAVAEADRDRDADLALDVAGEARQRHAPRRRRAPPRSRSDRETPRRSTAARPAASAPASARGSPRPTRGIFGHVGRQDDRLRAELQRPRHRHRRAHAEGAGDVAAGRDDAAPPAAADDQRLVGSSGRVALLDRGVEGVAIDMGDRQIVGAASGRGAASRSAGSAPAASRRRNSRGSRGRSAPSQARVQVADAGAGRRGRSRARDRSVEPIRGGEGEQQRLVGQRHNRARRRESRDRPPPARRLCGPEARQSEKALQPLGLGGEEAQRGDRDVFAVARRGCRTACALTARRTRPDSPFVNVSA